MKTNNRVTRKALLLGAAVLLPSLLIILAAYHFASPGMEIATPTTTAISVQQQPYPTATSSVGGVKPSPTPPGSTGSQHPNPIPDPRTVLGVDLDPGVYLPGISWVRLAYPTCGWGILHGSVLKSTVAQYHAKGMHVLVIICQPATSGPKLFNTQDFNDVAQSYPDAVQCGNEQMKQNALTAYVAPADFARFYDLCSRAVHALQPGAPVLMGALDPQVYGDDGGGLANQVSYLDQMQTAMNTAVHPGGNWAWHSQVIGLIDSWHNGYPSQDTNNLYGLYTFWAQQFNVDLNSGALGKHIWVVEGTGCFKDCGIDASDPYQVSVSHILTLITDVQTTRQYGVPFFFFTYRDFIQSGVVWPIGLQNVNGSVKPIRQDLPMGARVLAMGCADGRVNAVNQVQLLASMYQGCALPGNYLGVLTS